MASKVVFVVFITTLFGFEILPDRETTLRQELRSLKLEVKEQVERIRQKVEKEKHEFQKVNDYYITKCSTKNTTGEDPLTDPLLALEVTKLKSAIEQCPSKVEEISKKLKIAKYAFRSQADLETVRSRLAFLQRQATQLEQYLWREGSQKSKPAEEAEKMRHEIFYLTHVDETKLIEILPKPTIWTPSVTKETRNSETVIEERFDFTLKIQACPPSIKQECVIHDIGIVNDDSFVVTYSSENYIRHFRNNGDLLGELRCPWNMRGLKVLNQTHVMVGVPLYKAVNIVELGELIRVKAHIRFDINCGWDIDKYDDKYVIVCRNPNSVRMYTKDWKFIWSVGDVKERNTFVSLSYVRVDRRHRQILVSDNSSTVWGLNHKGSLLFSTRSGEAASGESFEVDDHGDFYVCDKTNGRVDKFSRHGRFLDHVLKVSSPRAIAINSKTNTMVLSSSESILIVNMLSD